MRNIITWLFSKRFGRLLLRSKIGIRQCDAADCVSVFLAGEFLGQLVDQRTW